jgi:RNA polymerase sigma-70 factor (ECF subfamily)
MSEDESFRELICRVRAGDDQAATELVRKYEPLIRREVRLHLEDRRLRRMFDSMDVAQSVLASFFVRSAAGEYDLESPEQLVKLLSQITRNKLASAARGHYRQRRDTRRMAAGDEALRQIAADNPTASVEIANQDLLDALREQLTEGERQIARLRADGRSWDEIASALGKKAQALRMQFTRGVERAARVLGLADLYE